MPAPNPATGTAPAGPTPAIHPMDPSRGENLSPRFAAILCFLIGRPAMTEPAITGVVVSGDAVFAATAESRFHDTLIGSWHDVEGTRAPARASRSPPPQRPRSRPERRSAIS